ncbi:MAG: hypothetical protein KC427_05830 [Sulfurovum sp.]|uniref:multiheme c-type cytochrome n=1 Tax=Sulfurovum sp. TaxID=1969726 RepID=UPI0028683201|nr:multiheme c-type cytochrome [Sulfurovum sp.]MCO4845521.1 hypothetical protein [Sulfurovum sp.]
MKLNVKALTLLLSAGVILSLTGCGGSSSSSGTVTDSEPGPGELGYQVLSEDNKTITYVDYTDGTRDSVISAAAAEYHTGVDFNNTLFDSADKKCQNCHNELYDTWKSSMHGQSWDDKIFQSKFQDFLRTHLAKIGEDKTAVGGIVYQQATIIDGDGVGSKNMFSGASQTCIKCHAPGAYYAGDVRVTVTELMDAAADLNLTQLKLDHELNAPHGETAVIAANSHQGKIYKATFQIGHEANREGINCAFCHSIETPRLMSGDGMDNGLYTLAKDMRVGPHGPVKQAAGTDLIHDDNASSLPMNKFFRLWGPEKYHTTGATTAHTPKGVNVDHAAGEFDIGKKFDGRYTMTSKDINGTDGKTHFTGGPFYGPYGVTGTTNENGTDETNRTALVNPHYDVEGNNHFGESGKGLCLSCHQRSAGAWSKEAGAFMELCSTQMAVTTGDDTASNDSMSSPKCQKCHMERIEGTVLHQWARPDKLFTLADNPALTGHFDPEDPDNYGDDNPVAAGWLNSHAFLGASKTFIDPTRKASAKAKIQSGFDATLEEWNNGSVLVVTTTLTNKTAHMFPGAHPMRRTLTRVIVTDENGEKIEFGDAYGQSTFDYIENNVQPLLNKKLHSSALEGGVVPVANNGSENLSFPGKVADLSGDAISSQKFDGTVVTLTAVDGTVGSQTVSATGVTTGTNSNAAIVDSNDSSNFTRIYGHETGKRYDLDKNSSTPPVFVVRPGFDSNVVGNDNRLSPNETETYHLVYNIAGKTGIKVEYRVYYMQKGANGKFIAADDGFLNQAASDAKKLLVTEVGTYSETL